MVAARMKHTWSLLRGRVGHSLRHGRMKAFRYVRYALAWLNRGKQRQVTVIGITGSAGKTTAKDLCAATLGEVGLTHSSRRSMNEHDAVAETIRGIGPQHRFCVVELSAGRPGYLDLSLKLSRPDVAVLTLIAREHFSAFKSVEAIAQEKGKLVAALPPRGVAVLNIDDPQIKRIGESCGRRVIWVGEGEGATLRLREARSRWPESLTLIVEHQGSSYEVPTRLNGTHLALPVLSALGVALALDIPLPQAIEGLMRATPSEGRMQVVPGRGDIVFIRDDWKAPMWSLEAPFAFLRQAQAKRKVVIIGTLSDYSLSASKLYPKVARQALEIGELVIFVGPHAMRAVKDGAGDSGRQILGFPSLRHASEYLKAALQPGDLVLLKGSHKTDHMVRLILDREKAIHCWQEKCGRSTLCDRCDELYKPVSQPRSLDKNLSATEMGLGASNGPSINSPSTVIVGLGNPGAKYFNTSHNVGYRVLEHLADKAGGAWEAVPEGQVCFIKRSERTVALFKPGVSMNRSGEPLGVFLKRVGASTGHCVVVHDDTDLMLGDVRRKRDGGDAGHLGVRSVIASLGTGKFERIRVGVRRHGDTERARALVLTEFTAADCKVVAQALVRVAELLDDGGKSDQTVCSATSIDSINSLTTGA